MPDVSARSLSSRQARVRDLLYLLAGELEVLVCPVKDARNGQLLSGRTVPFRLAAHRNHRLAGRHQPVGGRGRLLVRIPSGSAGRADARRARGSARTPVHSTPATRSRPSESGGRVGPSALLCRPSSGARSWIVGRVANVVKPFEPRTTAPVAHRDGEHPAAPGALGSTSVSWDRLAR